MEFAMEPIGEAPRLGLCHLVAGERLRDLLRQSAAARQTYAEAKQRLAARFPDDRSEYTAGKGPTVQQLLATMV